MKLPIVYPLTRPSSQSTIKMIAMVSSMAALRRMGSATWVPGRCGRAAARIFLLLSLVFPAEFAAAQTASPLPPQPYRSFVHDGALFLLGAGSGLLLHESGHLFYDVTFDADPRVKRVHFGPVPFFAITHRADMTPRREFVIDSAGFWMQEATSEWLLTRRPRLADE